MPKGLTTLLCRLCGCGINHQDNLTLLLLCSWTLIYLPYSSLPQRLRSDATNTKVPSGTWISYMQFANTEEKDRRQKGNPPHKCPQVTGLQIWHWLIYLPSAPAQKRVQQLKSNERRSNKNKRTASDVGSKDDQIVTQEVIRSMTGETPGLRRHVGGKKNKTIFLSKHLWKNVLLLNCCCWSRDPHWRRCCWISMFVRDGHSRETHRIPARHVLQQLAAHPVAASHLISRVNKGSRTRQRLLQYSIN